MNTKIALVTGGSSGIGRCTAAALKNMGCKVYEMSRRDIPCEGIIHLTADVTNENAVKSADSSVPAMPPWQDFEILTLGVYLPRAVVRENIRRRLDARFEIGMIDEIRKIHDVENVSWEKLERFGLEYREISLFLQGKCSEQEMRTQLLNKIRQFAKRQDIFFRKIERENFPIYWLDAQKNPVDDASKLIKTFLANEPLPPVPFKLSDITNPA